MGVQVRFRPHLAGLDGVNRPARVFAQMSHL